MADEKTPLHRQIPVILITAFVAGIGGFFANTATGYVRAWLDGPALRVRVLNGALPAAELPVAISAMLTGDDAWIEDVVGSPDALDRWRERSFALSDVATSYHKIRVELRSPSEQPVLVESITPRLLTRADPLGGAFIADGGCGTLQTRKILIDMDEATPSARLLETSGGVSETVLYVSSASVEVLDIMSYTDEHYVEWVLDVAYSGPFSNGVVTVDNAGEPFRLSSERGARPTPSAGARKTRRPSSCGRRNGTTASRCASHHRRVRHLRP
jgi:hypothetical protein